MMTQNFDFKNTLGMGKSAFILRTKKPYNKGYNLYIIKTISHLS